MYLVALFNVSARAENIYVTSRFDRHIGKRPCIRLFRTVGKFVAFQIDFRIRRVVKFYPVGRLTERIGKPDMVFRSYFAYLYRVAVHIKRRKVIRPALFRVREKRSRVAADLKGRTLFDAVHRLAAVQRLGFKSIYRFARRRQKRQFLAALFGKTERGVNFAHSARVSRSARAEHKRVPFCGDHRSARYRPHRSGGIKPETEARNVNRFVGRVAKFYPIVKFTVGRGHARRIRSHYFADVNAAAGNGLSRQNRCAQRKNHTHRNKRGKRADYRDKTLFDVFVRTSRVEFAARKRGERF